MSEADKIRSNMYRLDKKVQRLNQMISNFDREMRSIKSRDKSSQQRQASENSSSASHHDAVAYEFKFTDDRGGELQRRTEVKTQRHNKPRDDIFSFLMPEGRTSYLGKIEVKREDLSKSANKERKE